jgi:hypothetical protein
MFRSRSRSRSRGTRRTGTLACLGIALGVGVAVAGCASEDGGSPAPSVEAAAEASLGHVHGLGVDPADDTLYVASHHGVFRVVDGTPERVADRWQDTMGFAVVGPGHFLGSGHPDLREDLPSSLGLIESTDGAQTWQPVSLQGDADFHSIEAVGNRIYAYDSHTGALMVSDDRTSWNTISKQPLYDLAANPAEPDTVYATTDQGGLIVTTDGDQPVPVDGAPVLTGIDWQPDGPLVGVAPDGTVMVADDATTWRQVGNLDGPTQALDVKPGRWHAATDTGVYESTDDGENWRLVLAANHA